MEVGSHTGAYLVPHVQIRSLPAAIDSPRKPRLRAEGPGIRWRDKEGLRPRALKAICAHRNNIYT